MGGVVRHLSALLQNPVDVRRVGHEVVVLGLDGLKVRNQCIRKAGLEVPPPEGAALGSDGILQRMWKCAEGERGIPILLIYTQFQTFHDNTLVCPVASSPNRPTHLGLPRSELVDGHEVVALGPPLVTKG